MKKQNAATLFKNPQLQESIIKQYKEAGLDFQVKHSNYNTQIIGGESVIKFIQTEHHTRVFVAYNKIVKDLKASERTVEILQGEWSTLKDFIDNPEKWTANYQYEKYPDQQLTLL